MDVYWVMMGGGDPVAYLKNRPSQFKAIHIKDEKEIGASGKMDFKPIFDQMYANNVKDWYVEVIQQEIIDQLIVDLTELEVVVVITERNASGSGLITNRIEIIAVHLQVQLIYDFLLDNVSPNHVFFEMDVYWVMMGGGDPVAYLKNRPSQLLNAGNRIIVSILFHFNIPILYVISVHLIEDRLEIHLTACAD